MTVRAQDIVDEALSWVRTPWQHQQAIKGVGVDCANYLAGVANTTRATPDVAFEKNYRRREDGVTMLVELARYTLPVALRTDASGLVSLEESGVRPADVLAFHDGKKLTVPRHLAFFTTWEPYPKMAHSSEHGVNHHRIDAHFRRLIHSIWRIPNLVYD